jgi:hypothetical protein
MKKKIGKAGRKKRKPKETRKTDYKEMDDKLVEMTCHFDLRIGQGNPKKRESR